MGSLRNPIGPLPSSIYWRRRAVLLSVLALLVLLALWVVNLGGGDGDNGAGGPNGKNPAPSITPGPSGSGPAISEHPGGRDESGDTSEGTGGSGGSGSGGSGSGSGAGAGSSGGAAGAGGAAGSGASGGSAVGAAGSGAQGTTSADRVPAGSSLPDCTSGGVTLTLRSVHNSYAPDEKPEFELVAKNTADKACKVDLGPKSAVMTVTRADGDDEFWSSKDCPTGTGTLLLRVPAEGKITYTVEWDRKASSPKCATPSASWAPAGTYLVEVKAAQLPEAKTSFVLAKD